MNTLKTSAESVGLRDAIFLRFTHSEFIEFKSDAYFYGKLDSLMDILFQLGEPVNNWEC